MKARKLVSLLLVLAFVAAFFSACKSGTESTEQAVVAGEGKITYPVTVTNSPDPRPELHRALCGTRPGRSGGRKIPGQPQPRTAG